MDENETLNLEDLLGDVTPSFVTPHLSKLSTINSKVRPKKIAEYIIRGMAGSLKHPVRKELLHEGEIHTIHYVNVEPLCTGSWAMLSLMLLQLSYGEQSTLIDAFYPSNLQLCAKAFAIVFTPELKSQPTIIKQDEQILQGIESANAGIAMILSVLKHIGTIPHADEINKNRQAMQKLVQTNQIREKYRTQYGRSQDASKHQDTMSR